MKLEHLIASGFAAAALYFSPVNTFAQEGEKGILFGTNPFVTAPAAASEDEPASGAPAKTEKRKPAAKVRAGGNLPDLIVYTTKKKAPTLNKWPDLTAEFGRALDRKYGKALENEFGKANRKDKVSYLAESFVAQLTSSDCVPDKNDFHRFRYGPHAYPQEARGVLSYEGKECKPRVVDPAPAIITQILPRAVVGEPYDADVLVEDMESDYVNGKLTTNLKTRKEGCKFVGSELTDCTFVEGLELESLVSKYVEARQAGKVAFPFWLRGLFATEGDYTVKLAFADKSGNEVSKEYSLAARTRPEFLADKLQPDKSAVAGEPFTRSFKVKGKNPACTIVDSQGNVIERVETAAVPSATYNYNVKGTLPTVGTHMLEVKCVDTESVDATKEYTMEARARVVARKIEHLGFTFGPSGAYVKELDGEGEYGILAAEARAHLGDGFYALGRLGGVGHNYPVAGRESNETQTKELNPEGETYTVKNEASATTTRHPAQAVAGFGLAYQLTKNVAIDAIADFLVGREQAKERRSKAIYLERNDEPLGTPKSIAGKDSSDGSFGDVVTPHLRLGISTRFFDLGNQCYLGANASIGQDTKHEETLGSFGAQLSCYK